MIFLQSVSKTFFSKHDGSKLALRPTTIALPTDRRVAILGDRLQGKTLLLRLLAGLEAPDEGEVIAPMRLSPIANSKTLFHPRLSDLENIRLVARMLGVDAHQLTLAVDTFCGPGLVAERPIYMLNGPQRRLLEIALLAALSFDCYLLDNASQIPRDLLDRFFDAAARRGAGMIFATALPRQVYEYADYAVVIANHTVRAFNYVEEAIESYERKAG
jgi:ABC-type polysaccharide/polyol phosphate transport system ATPase subunit